VPDESVGRRVRCLKCGKQFTAELPEEDAPEGQEDEPAEGRGEVRLTRRISVPSLRKEPGPVTVVLAVLRAVVWAGCVAWCFTLAQAYMRKLAAAGAAGPAEQTGWAVHALLWMFVTFVAAFAIDRATRW
jgi:hypothetical protein